MTIKKEVPEIQIGIISGKEIFFTFNTPFQESVGAFSISGRWRVHCSDNRIILSNDSKKIESENALLKKSY